MKRRSERKKTIPLWKREQLLRKRKKLVILSRFFLVFLLIICGVRLGGQVFKTLTIPFEDKSCWLGKLDWKRLNRINIVFKSESTVLVSLDKTDQTISFFTIPKDLYLKLPDGSLNQLGKVYEEGEENFGCGGKLLAETLQEFLGLPIDGYVKVPDLKFTIRSQEEAKAFVKGLQGYKWALRLRETLNWFSRNVKTNFSLWEIGNLWWQMKKVRFDKVFFKNLEDGEVLSVTIFPGGEEGKIADQVLLDEVVKECFVDNKIRFEALMVEVFNATDKTGVGREVGRFVSNLGANLVNVGNFEKKFKKSKIFVMRKSLIDSYTVARLARIFQAEIEVKEWEQAKGDLAVVVGDDYFQRVKESPLKE